MSRMNLAAVVWPRYPLWGFIRGHARRPRRRRPQPGQETRNRRQTGGGRGAACRSDSGAAASRRQPVRAQGGAAPARPAPCGGSGRELAATVEFNGKVIADPNAGGRIQATQSGRIEAGPKGLPTLGQKVAKGQVLAYLRPVASSIERGNQQAQFAEIDAQLAIAERKLARYVELEGVVSKAAIETARFEAEALKKRRAAVGASIGAAEPLAAPVSGVIGAANVVAGQVVEAKEILFEVIDPARLAVEALAYDPALAEGLATASAPLPGNGALELQFVGGGRQLREQAIPLLFRVKSTERPGRRSASR